MIEFLKHTLGLCGEGHPSILYYIPFITVGVYMIKSYIKVLFEILKTIV